MKRDSQLRSAGCVLGLFLVNGCTVGPNYHEPNVATPAQWHAPLAGGVTSQPSPDTEWWKSFNDPELNSLLERAVAANHDLRIAQARVREARLQYRIIASRDFPTVDAGAAYARDRQSKNQPIIGSLPLPGNVPFENNVYHAGFDASWEIDVFGGTRRAREAGRAQVDAAQFGYRDALVTLLAEVARTYVDTRALQQRLSITEKNIRSQREMLALTQERFDHGLASDLDVRQATTLLAMTESQVPALEIFINGAIARLEVLLGQSPGSLSAELSPPAAIPVTTTEVCAGLPSDLLRRRPDVQRAERQLAAATAQIGIAEADRFPKFSLTGDFGYLSTSAGDWFSSGSKFWSIGPAMQWRIFDAGRIRANVQIQNVRQEQALDAYEQTVLSAFEEVEHTLVAYAKEQIRRRSLQEAVASSTDTLHLAQQLYRSGLASFINVLDAERSLYLTEDALAQSDRQVSTNLIALFKALGGGWEVKPNAT